MANVTRHSATAFAISLSAQIKGKTVLITGGTLGGIGAECAEIIARHSPKLVIVTARNQARLNETFASIRKSIPDAPLRGLVLDLSSLADVRKAATDINAYSEVVDVLIHNAGVATHHGPRTADGFDLMFATNNVGPFLLTKLVLPKMLTSPKHPRIVTIASVGHKREPAGFPWPASNDPKDVTPNYSHTKILNYLFATGLARKSGGRVDSFTACPGRIASQLSRGLTFEEKRKGGFINEDGSWADALGTLDNGCAPYIVAAFDTDLPNTNGAHIESTTCVPTPEAVAEFAKGVDLEDKFWALAEAAIGEVFVP